MIKILEKLDLNLKTLRPEYYSELNKPLNDFEIDILEEKFQIKLPTNIRKLYKWRNGQKQNCYLALVNNSIFLPLEQSLEISKYNTSLIGHDFDIENWWNEKWIPLFHNGNGDYICFDQEGIFTGHSGQLIEFWHADNDRNVISPSLDIFIQTLNVFLESNDIFDEFFSLKKKIENYPKRFKVIK